MNAPSNLRRLRGARMALTVPGRMLSHLARPEARAREADALAGLLAPYEGFDFGTFQIVEHDARTTPAIDEVSAFDDWPAPDIEWHFVLSSVLETFIAAGLDEIDVQMYLRRQLGIDSPQRTNPGPALRRRSAPSPPACSPCPASNSSCSPLRSAAGETSQPPAAGWPRSSSRGGSNRCCAVRPGCPGTSSSWDFATSARAETPHPRCADLDPCGRHRCACARRRLAPRHRLPILRTATRGYRVHTAFTAACRQAT